MTETRVGLIGAGYIATWHADALKATPGVRVAAVCDVSEGAARGLARVRRGEEGGLLQVEGSSAGGAPGLRDDGDAAGEATAAAAGEAGRSAAGLSEEEASEAQGEEEIGAATTRERCEGGRAIRLVEARFVRRDAGVPVTKEIHPLARDERGHGARASRD